MSTLRTMRSWPKRPRSQVQEVISSVPASESTGSSTETADSIKAKEAALRVEALLKSTKALLCDAEELFSKDVSLCDPRIQAMRSQVEEALSVLYGLAQDCSSSHTSSHNFSFVMRTAEAFLKRVSDAAQKSVQRPHNSPPPKHHSPPVGAGASPNANVPSPTTYSPPRVSLPQAQRPAAQWLQPHAGAPAAPPRFSPPVPSLPIVSTPLSSGPFTPQHTPNPHTHNQSPGIVPFAVPQPVPGTTHPSPATPSPSALVQPGSYPDTRRQYVAGASRPPLWGQYYEASYTPSHLYDEVEHTTRHQKMVLCAVHDLLQKRSSRLTRQPWYEPPIGLSPEELVRGQGLHNDPRFHHPPLGGQFQRYIRPAHPSPSPGGYAYHVHGNRSVAVGTCLPRSASME